MTRRRGRRRADPLPVALGALGAVLAVLVLLAVLHAVGLVLVLAGVGGGGYALGRRHRPAVSAPPCRHCAAGQCGRCNGIGPCACPHNRGGRPLPASVVPLIAPADLAALRSERDGLARQVAALGADRDQAAGLRADAARLAAELADARESAALAWDAAASVPRPADPERDPGALTARMLADPLSGVRRLGPG